MKQSYFRPGQRWTVTSETGALWGMQPHADGGLIGWKRDLKQGEIITCAGVSMSRNDGVPLVKWNDGADKPLAIDCEFRPSNNSMWSSAPEDGQLQLAFDTNLRSPDDLSTWSGYECCEVLPIYGYIAEPWDDFVKNSGEDMINRAKSHLADKGNPWVIWDPNSSSDGYLVVASGPYPSEARDLCSNIAHDASEGPLAIADDPTKHD